jgi:hypothetical protein
MASFYSDRQLSSLVCHLLVSQVGGHGLLKVVLLAGALKGYFASAIKML